MNTLKEGLKNYKTTIIAIIMAVVVIIEEQSDLSDWKAWVLPSIIAIAGILAKDATKSGAVKLLMIGGVALFSLPSCTAIDVRVDKSRLKTETADYAYYPSSAVLPVVNPDEVNLLIQKQITNIIISAAK